MYDKNFYQIRSNNAIWEQLKKETETVGYYQLPSADVSAIVTFAKGIKQKYIVVLGIGGSSLGSRAIYEFVRHKQQLDRQLLFLETTGSNHDPIDD
jgi:glucose-6-phosphate isomerase